MRESVEFIELTSLKKVGKDCWKFSSRGNTSFDHVFESLTKAHAFDARTVYEYGDDYYHFVNDEGIWLLSHCFSNWDEMFEQATKKSPWEAAWQKRTEQGEPPHCIECDMALYDNYTHCQVCSHFTCSFCIEKHQKTHTEEKKCAACGGDPAGPLVHCPSCQKEMCESCMEIHYKKHETEKQKATENYCMDCGKPKTWKFGIFVTCPLCNGPVCIACLSIHQIAHQTPGHNTRAEYGFNPDRINLHDFKINFTVDHEAIRRMFESFDFNFEETRKRAEEAAKATEERMRQQAEEAARRERERQQSQHKQRTSVQLEMAFQVLNLSTRATTREIKRAFRRKAKEAHPDTGGSEQMFKALNAAYQLALTYAENNGR